MRNIQNVLVFQDLTLGQQQRRVSNSFTDQ